MGRLAFKDDPLQNSSFPPEGMTPEQEKVYMAWRESMFKQRLEKYGGEGGYFKAIVGEDEVVGLMGEF